MSSHKDWIVVTGASSGIGLELARCAARAHHPLVICAHSDKVEGAAAELRREGVEVLPVQADLGTNEGIARLVEEVGTRPLAGLILNAGIGEGGPFLEAEISKLMKVVEVNLRGVLGVLHPLGRHMQSRGEGRIMITGSMVGYIPGSNNAVYNATKAFIDNFAYALRDELKGSGVTVTCLMPGPTESGFFDAADMEDSLVGRMPKMAPEEVAAQGWRAMQSGEAGHVTGLMSRIETMFTGIIPQTVLAAMHRHVASPKS